jgi:hypothetical protein
MEFLDISLTKGESLLLHAIHSILYWRILRKTIVFSGFKNSYKKSAKQENPRNQTKTLVRENEFMPRNLD